MSSNVASPTSPTAQLPTRSATDDDAVPDEDSSEVTKLFFERLQAWKHACGYLEEYVSATEKLQEHQSKEFGKVLKTVNQPLKEGHHFEQQNGGIAGLFESVRTNTQGIANSHADTAKTLKGTVLPILERLHAEIKSKEKELNKSAGKGAKAVDKARQASQKHIELLGQHSAASEATGSNVKAGDDPYLLQRQIYHRLNKQVIEENSNRDDMISVQNSFATFEAHVIETFQQGMTQFNQVVANQAEQTRNMYGDMLGTTQRVPRDFEWNGFLKRNSAVLIDPSSPKRSIGSIKFANQDHRSTQPLIAGSLSRKSGLLKKYDASFYAVTPSKYLHEFKTDDDFAKDPSPENSLYLPDCLIGAVDGDKFVVKGKDTSKGSMGGKLAMSKEFAFKAHTAGDAHKWHDVIASVAGQSTGEVLHESSAPGSPEVEKSGSVSQSTGTTGSGAFEAAAAPGTVVTTNAEKDAAGPAQGVATGDKVATS